MVVAKRRVEDERARDLSLAWTIEALHRQKKLPSLNTLLGRKGVRETQTLEQQRAMLYILSSQYGIPLRKTRLRKVTPRA